MGWIDTHTHLHMLEGSSEQAIQEAEAVGVTNMITIGTTPDDLDHVYEIAKKHFPKVACALGIHPHDSSLYGDHVEQKLRLQVTAPWVVAVGEIGLDYYYENSEPETQKTVFRKQMQIAAEFGLPVEIHTRDAEADTIKILSEFKGKVRGVIHCFTGTQWLADRAIELGYNISLSGIITFKTAQNLRDVLKTLPLDRIFIETDAPFLAPIPMRGKKNVPAFLVHTAQFIAKEKNIEENELQLALRQNARAFFPKWTL